jgi:hypothetical protein
MLLLLLPPLPILLPLPLRHRCCRLLLLLWLFWQLLAFWLLLLLLSCQHQ